MSWILIGLATIALASSSTFGSMQPNSDPPQLSAANPSDGQNYQRVSVAACATCHGSHEFLDPSDREKIWRSSYQIWAARDPHANGYNTLRNAHSKQIVSALVENGSAFASSTRHPVLDEKLYQEIINQKCISCHSTVPTGMSSQWSANRDGSFSKLRMKNGVSCLSCHSETQLSPELDGQDWVVAHTKETWNDVNTNKAAMGLRDLKRLEVRAQACMKCHIGSEGREVNHDLVAAGHPRLVFEFASHMMRLPKHWTEERSNGFYLECWSIGQVESAKASLELLRHRVVSAMETKGFWPEFTEYNCHNCHHGLYGTWYHPKENGTDGKTELGNLVVSKKRRRDVNRCKFTSAPS